VAKNDVRAKTRIALAADFIRQPRRQRVRDTLRGARIPLNYIWINGPVETNLSDTSLQRQHWALTLAVDVIAGCVSSVMGRPPSACDPRQISPRRRKAEGVSRTAPE